MLAQEAKSAAALLREGMDSLTKSLPQEGPQGGVELSSTLDALDDTMRALSSLHLGAATRGRRGRIDVAALLLELAPTTTVDIEPGKGTEVFGDEVELRRMLQLLLSLGDASAQASIRRDEDAIHTSVLLGPDSSGGSSTEHAFLHRMATRHGGRLELEGARVVLVLPADADLERREMEDLRRELVAAQEQGEAYARELAEMFTKNDPPPAAVATSVRSVLGAIGGALTKGVDARALGAALERFGALPHDEPYAALHGDAIHGLEVRAKSPAGPAAWVAAFAALLRAEGADGSLDVIDGRVVLQAPHGLTTSVAEALGLSVTGTGATSQRSIKL